GVTPATRPTDAPSSGGVKGARAAPKPPSSRRPAERPAERAAERRRERQELRRRREAEIALTAATHVVDRARKLEQAARQKLDRAEADVRAAEQAVADARHRFSTHRS